MPFLCIYAFAFNPFTSTLPQDLTSPSLAPVLQAVDPQQLSVNFEPAAKKVKGAKGAAQKSGATKGAKGGAKGAGAKGGGTKGPAKPKSGGKGGATRQLTLV